MVRSCENAYSCVLSNFSIDMRLLLVIAWLNKQVNEKLTLSASEFEKYGGSKRASQPSSDTSVDYKVCNGLIESRAS